MNSSANPCSLHKQGVFRMIKNQRGGGLLENPLPSPPPESLWLLEAPVRNIILQMHTPARTSQCWSRQTQHGLGVCIWMHLVNSTGNSPSPGQPTPGVVKQDKSSGGSVDTTKTRSGPQRVRKSSGERPIGAAKGKQSDTKALCQPPPPDQSDHRGNKRNLQSGQSCRAIVGAEIFGSQTPSPPPAPSKDALFTRTA